MRRDRPDPTQEILNRRWPRDHASIPDRPYPQWVRVTARIHWERDGVEWVEGSVKRWTSEYVYVTFPDYRMRRDGVWLEAADVKRR